MTVLEKVPFGGWQAAWGNLAWARTNDCSTVWDLDTRRELRLPVAEVPIVDLLCNSERSRLFVLRSDGSIDAIALERLDPSVRLQPPGKNQGFRMTLSSDGHHLFCYTRDPPRDLVGHEEEATTIAIFSVSDLRH